MKNIVLIILFILFFVSCYAQEIKLPAAINYEGELYLRELDWKDNAEIIEHDVDGDGKKEIIARIRGEPQVGAPRAFTVIYKLAAGKLKPEKVILGGEYPSEMDFFDIDGDKIDDIILFDSSGMHYTTIMVYSFKGNEYKCIFKNGTACYRREVKTDIKPVRIIIGRENWKDKEFSYASSAEKSLLEIWVWDGKQFTYSPQLSTTPVISEEEALEAYWQLINKEMSEMGGKEGVFHEDAGKFLLGSGYAGERLEDFKKRR